MPSRNGRRATSSRSSNNDLGHRVTEAQSRFFSVALCLCGRSSTLPDMGAREARDDFFDLTALAGPGRRAPVARLAELLGDEVHALVGNRRADLDRELARRQGRMLADADLRERPEEV